MKNVQKILFLSLLVGAVLFTLNGCRSSTSAEGDASVSAPDLSGNLIQRFAWERTATGHDSTVFTGHGKNATLKATRFQDLSAEHASDYISSKIFVLNSLYREIRSPYPGQLSNRIECAEEFKPVEVENSPSNYYIIYATDRFTYGACSWDLITYRTILYFLHCEEENSFYQIELFVPVDEYSPVYEESLKVIECRR